ncbi:nucleoside triphosphate pyrophosphohydrolase [Candidatus Finniella inopinata]|uniref:Phosphoribosyl-ATP pyrophosphohydrolase n=1 Tax=Candidatus Finniella inopinata TaxID=1696036 RepID=A0A4Q7DKU6_9PROT|nr:nucleoside triphosphate pyrophosphohydrolase [Candidatus Finniella inopinata]RZI46845.1 phosphoribosyl-ATP pyrophosphohydrolase [Candidatus Finniella inopinata]
MTKKHRFKVDKLTRDKMPDIMRSLNIDGLVRIMDADEYLMRLQDKLLEEAKEVIAAKTPDEYVEELADVLEVMHALANRLGLSYEQIEEKRQEKKREKGGFEGRVYVAYGDVAADNENIRYYRDRSEDYPEIV